MEHNNFCVYELVDHNNIPFYIGRTFNIIERIKGHKKDINNKNNNSYKVNKIKKLIRTVNYKITYNIIYEKLSYNESIELEKAIILLYKENKIKLTNISEGGEGLADFHFTEKHKTKLKESRKKLFDSGYEVYNKNKKLEELFSEERVKEIKDTISKGVQSKKDRIIHNKNKKIEDIYDKETVEKIRKITAETAKKTFTGTVQSKDHIKLRAKSQSDTKQNWNIDMKKYVSNINSKNAMNGSIKKRQHIKIMLPNNNELNVYLLFTEISKLLFNDFNIKCNAGSISAIIKGKQNYLNTKHKCNFILLQ